MSIFTTIISRNDKKFASIKNIDSDKVAIYISPSDFNPIISGQLIPNKVIYIKEKIIESGIYPFYLLRESLNSSEAIPASLLARDKSIVKVRTNLWGLVWIFAQRKLLMRHNQSSINSTQISKSILSEYLLFSLEDSLTELSPRAILTIGATQDLLLVANKLGIPVVEVMHGVIFEEDIRLMWTDRSKLKPNLVITWHKHYTRILEKCNVDALTLGYPSKYIEPRKRLQGSDIRVLVTLGHSHLESSDPYGFFDVKLMNQVARIYGENIKLVFRTHPVIDSNKRINSKSIKWLQSRFIVAEIQSPRKKSLWDSLQDVDIHLSKSSSSFIEAALVGIPTIFTDDLAELQLPQEVLDSEIVFQGGALDYQDLITIALRKLPDEFKFMNEKEVLKFIKVWLNP